MASCKARLLSLDGGGIRGIVTAQILTALETQLNHQYTLKYQKAPDRPLRIAQYFDLLSGTSTGGILACLLLVPDPEVPGYPKYSAAEAVKLYFEHGRTIFSKSTPGRFPLGSTFFGSKYTNTYIENLMKQYFGDLRMSQLLKPCLITSYDIEKRRAVFFTQHDAINKGPMHDFLVSDVVRSTSAAPTYFPPAQAKSTEGLVYHTIDGGLFANNPTMCAVIESLKLFGGGNGQLLNPSDMLVVSIGTGQIDKQYKYDKAVGWGVVNWISPIIDIMMSAVSETVDYQLKKLYEAIDKRENYYRIMPDLYTADSEMDNTKMDNLEALRQAGLSNAIKFEDQLSNIAKHIMEESTY